MNITPYEYQIIITSIVILWFEVFNIGTRIKRIIYRDPIKQAQYKKPWDCRLCTHFWIGTIMALSYFAPSMRWEELIIALSFNTVTSLFYERVQAI